MVPHKKRVLVTAFCVVIKIPVSSVMQFLANKGIACFPNQPAFMEVACGKPYIRGVRVYARVAERGRVFLNNQHNDPLEAVHLQGDYKCVVHLCNTGEPLRIVDPFLGNDQVEFVTDDARFAEALVEARGEHAHPRIGLNDVADSPVDFLVVGYGALEQAPPEAELYVEDVATVREARRVLSGDERVAEVILDAC